MYIILYIGKLKSKISTKIISDMVTKTNKQTKILVLPK